MMNLLLDVQVIANNKQIVKVNDLNIIFFSELIIKELVIKLSTMQIIIFIVVMLKKLIIMLKIMHGIMLYFIPKVLVGLCFILYFQ